MPQPIRVFVSYSGDDWDAFVEPMARSLRTNGIDAVAANWDLHPGESIAQWILEKELPTAEVVVIVLSESSVNKPWVREELDHATVRRIEDRIKIIPFRIDDCEVPSSLRTIKRISVHSPEEWGSKIQELIDAIYRTSNKPPLGNPPVYTSQSSNVFPEETSVEGLVLTAICDAAFQNGHYHVNFSDVTAIIDNTLAESQIAWATRRLEARGVLNAQQNVGGGYVYAEIGLGAAATYCATVYPDFGKLQRQLGAEIAGLPSNAYLLLRCPDGVPELAFRVAIDTMKSRGWFETREILGGGYMITNASPFIEDWLEELG